MEMKHQIAEQYQMKRGQVQRLSAMISDLGAELLIVLLTPLSFCVQNDVKRAMLVKCQSIFLQSILNNMLLIHFNLNVCNCLDQI